MSFDPLDATEHEAQVAVGDSGGAVFTKSRDGWELAGILFAANTYSEQPPETALFGNVSLAADLSHYRDQILEITRGADRGPAADSCRAVCGDGFAASGAVALVLAARGRRRRPARRAADPQA